MKRDAVLTTASNVAVVRQVPPSVSARSTPWLARTDVQRVVYPALLAVVLLMTGNSATMVAHTTKDAVGFLIQMMSNGAMATIGVTCSNTA